ncbi:unnamed protein product [Didymodactylos carnosus]|uniref:NAD(P)(+)--arginine ADP-ribosyltransferase n=1 Tax=Didymodactylos carnosus TaxID=1234261 RepID=A0A815GDQ1_9BILA|nr:unnamed protein product [Didymodactylos carnosus]CAF4197049.1 unnamed protein product [Didymodactylos carnosus]
MQRAPRICEIKMKPEDTSFGFAVANGNDGSGLYIQDVVPNSQAYLVGLRKNDRILEVDGKKVENDESSSIIAEISKAKSKEHRMAFCTTIAALRGHFFVAQPLVQAQASTTGLTPLLTPFYIACRNNKIELVKELLETMTPEAINRIEPNGSTALHVASYQGHKEIVELLLQNHANHAIINKHNCTPLEEAKTDEIKQLIITRRKNTRFCSVAIEWILATNDADYQAHEYWKKLEAYGKDPKFYHFINYIKEDYVEKDLKEIDRIDTIRQYFDRAFMERDPLYLIKAYTADTGFYSTLNVHLAQLRLENLTAIDNLSRAHLIAIIARHPKFDALSYIGTTYRGMLIIDEDLKQYKVGTRILTKTFSSTSKEIAVARRFLDSSDSSGRFDAICTYTIRNQRTALDIEKVSVFKDEQEVLILPYSAFKIIEIRRNESRIEIELKECEPWN